MAKIAAEEEAALSAAAKAAERAAVRDKARTTRIPLPAESAQPHLNPQSRSPSTVSQVASPAPAPARSPPLSARPSHVPTAVPSSHGHGHPTPPSAVPSRVVSRSPGRPTSHPGRSAHTRIPSPARPSHIPTPASTVGSSARRACTPPRPSNPSPPRPAGQDRSLRPPGHRSPPLLPSEHPTAPQSLQEELMKESPLGSQRPSRIPSPAQRQHSQVAAPPGEQINTECSSAAEKRDGRETLTEEEIAKRQQIKENERQAKARRKREKDSIRAKAAADLNNWQIKEE